MNPSKSTTFYFDNLDSAAMALLQILLLARRSDTTESYRFGGLSAPEILASGLRIEGDIDKVASRLEKIPGAVRQDD